MKKYLTSILGILYLLIAFNSYGEYQITNCNCLDSLRNYNNIYKNAWIGSCAKESVSYSFYLESTSIKSRMIFDPSLYSEYYQNLHVFNESLVNFLNYKINESEVFPNLDGKNIDKVRNNIIEALEKNDEADRYIRNRARAIYESCYYRKHFNPMTLYDNSFLEFVEGNSEKSAELAEKYISVCKELNINSQSSSTELMLLGKSCIEMAQYFKAIQVLSDLIQKDPTNKEAHFHRATAYFETGNYDEAIADFVRSDQGEKISKSNIIASNEFTQALIASACQGTSESAIEFVPSFCSSVYGLSKTLWTIHWSVNPLNQTSSKNIKNFANTTEVPPFIKLYIHKYIKVKGLIFFAKKCSHQN